MTWWKDLLGVVPSVTSGVTTYFSRKHELALKKIEFAGRIEEAKAEGMIALLRDRQAADVDWEKLSIQNSGWKDEWFTIALTLMVVAIFLPWTQETVIRGFGALEATPTWFQVSFLVAVGSAFGVRVFGNFLDMVKGKAK